MSVEGHLLTLKHIVGSDSIAASYQTMGQYRTMLIQRINAALQALDAVTGKGRFDSGSIAEGGATGGGSTPCQGSGEPKARLARIVSDAAESAAQSTPRETQ